MCSCIERWENIEGYHKIYQISSHGRISEMKNKEYSILGPHTHKKGYLRRSLFYDKKQKSCLVHRLVGKAFINNPLNHPQINHKDGNKANNCVCNLEWVSCADNIIHSIKNRLSPNVGDTHYGAKLNNKKVALIKEMLRYDSKAFSCMWLAKCFKVDAATISDIKKNRSWKHVQ